MAPQQLGPRERSEDPSWSDEEEESVSPLPGSSPTVTGFPMASTSDALPTSSPKGPGYWRSGPYDPANLSTDDWFYRSRYQYSPTTTFVTESKKTPLGDTIPSSTSSLDPNHIATNNNLPSSPTASNGYGREHPPGWPWKKHQDKAPMYAAASIVPIVVLAIIGGIAFYCLRKRKKQRATAARVEMQSRVLPPYSAPSPAVAAHYGVAPSEPPPTSTPMAPPPVILGPIPSGDNGAYLTGIDTSDVVSITSNDIRPVDPFADNNLAEPPPPYRPRSIAPPSFVSASRQSSFRASDPHPATSQTHLIERSPFEDPPDDDDTVSEVSGPIGRRGVDAMSAVSDLSYQQDPVIGRTSV
ncbi:hypothetical protein IQ07DRAFT_3988 [Pyrenochaeta sp. DS3sAY3a]|nr:hypothetical protein IQ07DRAFT_3988 [Pyrenochaeta sp. DS3sAY3a]